jgi:hypothetical protein
MLIRALALTAGVAVSVLALLAWRLPASERVLGTDVSFEAVKPGELRLEPRGRFGSGRDLRPGGPPARATLTIGNHADQPLAVSVHARPGGDAASRALRVRISSQRFTLSRRGTRRLRVSASLPESARGDLRAQLATVRIGLRARAREGAR